MAWIKTVKLQDADNKLQSALEKQQGLYPEEYRIPVEALAYAQTDGPAIVLAHSLIPDALQHAFSTFGVLMSPELPLTRRQHEMIATTVSALNSCHY